MDKQAKPGAILISEIGDYYREHGSCQHRMTGFLEGLLFFDADPEFWRAVMRDNDLDAASQMQHDAEQWTAMFKEKMGPVEGGTTNGK